MEPNTLAALTVAAGATASAVGTFLAPVVLMYLTSRERRRDKLEDYRRQDEVAAKVDRAAAQAAVTQQANIRRTDEVARVAAAAAAEQRSQLKQIHTLVNSDMTAARQGELDQTRATLVMLKKIVAMDARDGRPPQAEDVAAIGATESRIKELQAILADRLVQMKAVEAEIRDAATAKSVEEAAARSGKIDRS